MCNKVGSSRVTKKKMSIINKIYKKIRVKIYQYLFIRNFQTYDEADIFCSRYFSDCYNNNYLNEYRYQKFKLNFNDLPFLNQPQYKCLTEIILLYIKDFITTSHFRFWWWIWR